MGTRYYLTLNCPHCKAVNKEVYFAPTCDMGSHDCFGCNKRFWIGDDLEAHKEPVNVDMRKHSMHGSRFEELVGSPPIQRLD